MKTITIKIIQWSDIKQWWLDYFGVRTIKRNARDVCDFIWGVYNDDLEGIIRKHYGDELINSNPKVYEDCVLELKEHLENICKQAQEIIHV